MGKKLTKETIQDLLDYQERYLKEVIDPIEKMAYVLMSDKLTQPFITNHLEMSWHLTEEEGLPLSQEDLENNNKYGKCVAVCGFANLDKLEEDITEDICSKNSVFWVECCGLYVSPVLTEEDDEDSPEEEVFRVKEAREIGLFKYFEIYYGLTNSSNVAGLIYEIAHNMNLTPVEFINYFCEVK